MAARLRNELGAGGDLELAEDVREVRLHRPPGDEQPLANTAVPEAVGDQLHHRTLGRGEALPPGLGAAPRAVPAARSAEGAQGGLHAGRVAMRSEPFVDPDTLDK